MQTRSFLKRVEARAALRDLLNGMLWAITLISFVFLLYAVVDSLLRLSFKARFVISSCLAIATLIALAFEFTRKKRARGLMWAATQVEAKTATLKNQLVTIADFDSSGRHLPPYLRVRIEDDLARKLDSMTAAQVLSLKPERTISLLIVSALVVYSLAIILSPHALRAEFRRLVLLSHSENSGSASATPGDTALNKIDGIEELRLVLTPPAYTRRGPTTQVGDGNIVALVGTRVDVQIKSHQELSAASLLVSGAVTAALAKQGERSYSCSFVVDQDSNYGLSLVGLQGANQKWEEVYSIRAIKDQPPEIHITSPASDLLFESENHPATVSIAITAKDDYEVASIRLKYIKTTGDGDAAKFDNGEVAINRLPGEVEGVTQGNVRLDLAALGVNAGSSVVFHAEAFDRNNISGPGTGYSENIIVEIRSPEPVKISLDDLRPDEALKYLTSERMILIKTEKLHRLRGKIAGDEFLSRSQQIATEQKLFKESFNQFAEIESDHEHGEGEEQAQLKSGDLPEIPTGGNESLREMVIAIRAMWKAEGALGLADTGRAIEHENEALVHLKAAQKGLRYSPRFAVAAKPVDLKRRYLGELDGVRSRLERVPRKPESEFDNRLRNSLALVYDAARELDQQKIKQARQNIERAADDLLSIKGELALSLSEPASKLKLLGRMLGSNESTQEAFALTVQVASEMSALLGRTGRAGFASSQGNLSPASRAKAATYFKLLANP